MVVYFDNFISFGYIHSEAVRWSNGYIYDYGRHRSRREVLCSGSNALTPSDIWLDVHNYLCIPPTAGLTIMETGLRNCPNRITSIEPKQTSSEILFRTQLNEKFSPFNWPTHIEEYVIRFEDGSSTLKFRERNQILIDVTILKNAKYYYP